MITFVEFKNTQGATIELVAEHICSLQHSDTEDGLPTKVRMSCGDMHWLPYTFTYIKTKINMAK